VSVQQNNNKSRTAANGSIGDWAHHRDMFSLVEVPHGKQTGKKKERTQNKETLRRMLTCKASTDLIVLLLLLVNAPHRGRNQRLHDYLLAYLIAWLLASLLACLLRLLACLLTDLLVG
jgi:hypothetical protein